MNRQREVQSLEPILELIPLAKALRMQVGTDQDGNLIFTSPHDASHNHYDQSFGGAIECLATLGCWSWLWLHLPKRASSIVIQRAEIQFLEPLRGEIYARTEAPAPERWRLFCKTLERHAKARIELQAIVGDESVNTGARFRGRYVITNDVTP